eukprot:8217744-Pyramimonas_sp.AAC.1
MAGMVQLVRCIKPYFRWVPSDVIFADGPSRRVELGAAAEAKAVHKARFTPQRLLRWLRGLRRRDPAGPSH